MKFGRVWSKVQPIDPECDWQIKTPTAIAVGSDRYDPDLARGYVSYPEPKKPFKFKDLWRDIINNLSSDDSPSNSYEHYREPQSFDVIDIKKAIAADGEIILHSMHDDSTNISQFYVEQGVVEVSDLKTDVGVVLSAGETIRVTPDTVPHDMDVQPASQVTGQWWEEWDDDSGLSIFVPAVLYILGIVFVIRRVWRSKRGFFAKIGIFILGFIIVNVIAAILMMFV
jgi:hypothetical protein